MSGNPIQAAAPGILKVQFEGGEGGVEQLPPRDHHDVNCRLPGWQVPENLSNQPFSSIALHRSAYLPRSDNAEPGDRAIVGQQQQREEPAVEAGATFENLLKLGATPDAPLWRETLRRPAAGLRRLHYLALPTSAMSPVEPLFRGHGQSLAALGATALEDQPALFRRHPHEKTVRASAAPVIGLKSAFAFHTFRDPCSSRISAEKT